MNTFFRLNRDKLIPLFIRVSLSCLGFVSTVLVIAYLTGNLPNKQLLLSIILGAGIGFPLFIMSLGYIGWLLHTNARQKTFSKIPFNQIEDIGFYKAYFDENSKWAFTEEIKEGKLNGFLLIMNFSIEKGYHFIAFNIPVEWKKIEKNEYNNLTNKLKQHNAEFRIDSIVKLYDTRKKTFQSISDIKQDLEKFTTLLIHEGFKPKI